MCGTSADGIDAAIVEIDASRIKVVVADTFALPSELRQIIIELGQGASRCDIDALGRLDIAIGQQFGQAANRLLSASQINAAQIRAIGSHGQTIRHRPNGAQPFSWQMGCPHVIAELTGIDVVSDFRRRDVAAGGQGAPLVPAFHRSVFPAQSAILNLGGIANITILGEQVLGFDTGPANCLLDAHVASVLGHAFDRDGEFAASGKVNPELLARLLADPYFQTKPPKSTGREYFNLDWLKTHLSDTVAPENIQATLLALTAQTVADALAPHASQALYVCGGGARNAAMMSALSNRIASVLSTDVLGVDPDFVEASAFAWLAYAHLHRIPGNLTQVTGAPPRVLGSLTLGFRYPVCAS